MKLATLTGRTAPLTLEFAGEELHLQFRPGLVTPRLEAELRSGQVSLPAALSRTITEWDLTDDAGEPYPLTEEALSDLDVSFLTQLLTAVVEGAVPNPTGSAT